MSLLDELKPRQNRRVIDLVRTAGVDVRNWAKFKGGRKQAASNPKYCYEWAFVERGRLVVLNLWHDGLSEQNRVVTVEDNHRKLIRKPPRTVQEAMWNKRADKFDRAVQEAAKNGLQIRAIINDGRRRKPGEQKPSRVQRRQLDPVPWAVTSYDQKTGDFVLRRGAAARRFADQFSVPPEPESKAERRLVSGMSYVRDAVFRDRALERAQGKCEFCGKPGFTMPDGKVFLETHHVVPLSDDGPDAEDNVAAICPNHHREAHHGSRAAEIRQKLLEHLRKHVQKSRLKSTT